MFNINDSVMNGIRPESNEQITNTSKTEDRVNALVQVGIFIFMENCIWAVHVVTRISEQLTCSLTLAYQATWLHFVTFGSRHAVDDHNADRVHNCRANSVARTLGNTGAQQQLDTVSFGANQQIVKCRQHGISTGAGSL